MEKSAEFQQISDLIYCASNALKDLAGKKDLLLGEWDYRIDLFPASGATQLETKFGERTGIVWFDCTSVLHNL